MSGNDLFDDLDNIHREMERLFHSLFNPKHPFHMLAERRWKPLTDMYESDDEVVVKVEIPGVSKDDISVTLDNRRLIIRGTRENSLNRCGLIYHQMEINYGEFERVLMLPPAVDTENIKAELKEKEGFLYIRIKTNKK